MSRALTLASGEVIISYDIFKWFCEGETAEEIYDSLDVFNKEKPPRDEFISKLNDAFPQHLIKDVRVKRDYLLKECDWTQSRDVDLADNEAWVMYRQQLRDLPQTINPIIGKPIDNYFPSPP